MLTRNLGAKTLMKLRSLHTIWLFLLMMGTSHAGTIKSMRFWQAPDSTRIVLDLSAPIDHQTHILHNPERLLVDIPKGELAVNLSSLKPNSTLIDKVRTSRPPDQDTVRIVFELSRKISVKSFSLKPYQQYGHRLVLDLSENQSPRPIPPPERVAHSDRDIVIAVDAGHGGDDPGAVGPSKTYEKKVTLAVAKRLVSEINKHRGYQAFLTRTGDYFIPLKKRTTLAREKKADLFVSIHADSFKNPKARGASVWVLNERGSKSEIGRWLKDLENNSDLLGGVQTVSLGDQDPDVTKIILDLSMDYSIGASFDIAEYLHDDLRHVAAKMHKNYVEQNNFAVLRNPDIPSVLVELGFISNPDEERLLRSGKYQRNLTRALTKGIKKYFDQNPPEGSLVASMASKTPLKYKVKRGDTLSAIAQRYQVSVSEIKKANRMRSNTIRLGATLLIPNS